MSNKIDPQIHRKQAQQHATLEAQKHADHAPGKAAEQRPAAAAADKFGAAHGRNKFALEDEQRRQVTGTPTAAHAATQHVPKITVAELQQQDERRKKV